MTIATLGSMPFGLVEYTQLYAPGGSVQARQTDVSIFDAPNFQQGIIGSYSESRRRAPASRFWVVQSSCRNTPVLLFGTPIPKVSNGDFTARWPNSGCFRANNAVWHVF